MAQLSGVKTVSDSVIEYQGKRYVKTEGPAQFGDLVRNDEYYIYLPDGAFYLVHKDGEIRDEDGDALSFNEDEQVLFRKEIPRVSTTDLIAQKRTELDALNEEITQLEAQLAEEQALKVRDWARVIDRTYNGDFDFGTIVRVDCVDGSDIPYRVEALGGKGDWARRESLEKITPAEARASLIAEIDELFSGEEAVASAA